MIIEVSVDFLVKHKITFEQYALCYFLYKDKYEVNKEGQRIYKESGPSISNIYKYSQNIKKWTKKEIDDIVDKGFIKKIGKKYSPDVFEITDKFVQLVFLKTSDFEHLLNLYPDRLDLGNGRPMANLKAFDYDELNRSYKSVVKTKMKHERIMIITKWAKENNMLNLSFDKFIKGRYWRVLEKLYEEQQVLDIKDHEMLL